MGRRPGMARTAESEDMYLKAIYTVKMRKPNVYAVDICDELNYVKSSVSVGLKLLKENGLITVDELNIIYFTEAGYKRAKNVYERYLVFKENLVSCGVPDTLAKETACKMEHAVSEEVFEYIKKDRLARRKNTTTFSRNESEDMYLKTIYLLSKGKNGNGLRAVEISNELGVTQSAILKAVRKMTEDGYITIGAHKKIFLTEEGATRAEKIYERYVAFTEILKSYGVPDTLAEETACKMEHVVSDDVFKYIKRRL